MLLVEVEPMIGCQSKTLSATLSLGFTEMKQGLDTERGKGNTQKKHGTAHWVQQWPDPRHAAIHRSVSVAVLYFFLFMWL